MQTIVQHRKISVGPSVRNGYVKILKNACVGSQGKTFEQALNTFIQATHSALLNAAKTPVVWEGTLLLLSFLPRVFDFGNKKWRLNTRSNLTTRH